jgi:sugar diacid utilization regulator
MPTAGRRRKPLADGAAKVAEDAWLARVAEAAAADARAPAELLGEHLSMLADAALTGRRPAPAELAAVADLGWRAAEQGVGAGRTVDLYLSAAWRLWRELPSEVRTRNRDEVHAAAETLLHVIANAVAALVEGYQSARRQMIRQEESLRREFIDDLLRGDADVARMVERAEPFGLDLGLPHQVALAAPGKGISAADAAAIQLERIIVDRFGDREVLVATKDGQVVVVVPSANPSTKPRRASKDVGQVMHQALSRVGAGNHWRVAAGRPYPGAYGVCRSYEEAREALTLGQRLRLDSGVVQTRDLLTYRVLGRDQVAIVDLIQATLGPLTQARGGAEPLLQTLQTYFATGEVATETARQLHLSVRTVTYRLAKVKALTGQDPRDPTQRFALHAAVLGARLLGWPSNALPVSG